jgi:hypothetical protein
MKPWQILYRQNKSAIETGVVTRNIPAYVAPTLKTFRIYGVYGEEPIAVDGTESILLGGAVIFYLEFNNPDGLAISNIRIPTDESWTRNSLVDPEVDVWWNQLTALGKAYLWQLCAGSAALSASPLTPSFYFTYLDSEGDSHEVGPATCSNGPLTIVPIETSIADATITVFQTASVDISPEGMDIQAEMDWGD